MGFIRRYLFSCERNFQVKRIAAILIFNHTIILLFACSKRFGYVLINNNSGEEILGLYAANVSERE